MIQRVIKNNVISAMDEYGSEIVVMGKGIGFQKRPGQEISETGTEKIFRLESPDILERFKELLANMPMVCIQVSDEIISHARKVLTPQLSQNVYLTLTDHIDFALTRFKEGMLFENGLYEEIKRFYPEEFRIGRHALDLIEERTGVRLPEDEAASIAFHLVNAEFGMKMKDGQMMTEMIRRLTEMVYVACPLQKDSLDTDRLVTNLKFILIRLLLHTPTKLSGDDAFNRFVREHCCREYGLAGKMKDYIESVSGCKMTEDEKIYLTIQLRYATGIDIETP